MNRRSMLLGLGVGGASVPLWLARSFDLDQTDETDCALDLDVDVVEPAPASEPPASAPSASETPGAPRTSRPQLVLVIPAERDERYYRGHAFGELLHAADDLTLARLALFDVQCTTSGDLEKMTGRPLKGEPWMVVIDGTGPKRAVTPLTDPQLVSGGPREDTMAEAKIDQRIALLSKMIETAATAAMIKSLAAAEALALTPPLKDELATALDDAVPPRLALADAATATLLARVAAPTDESDWSYPRLRVVILSRLAELTRERLLRTSPPAGARWATSHGCGVRIEGHKERHAIGCGMGHVPERSRRFLAWLGDFERGY